MIGAGVILMFPHKGEARYFLLCGRETGIWSFSKGHTENYDDNLLQTAIRETFEETGLTAGADYSIEGQSQRFGKRPYWVGIVAFSALLRMRIAPREHSIGGWFTVAEIRQLKSNADVRGWLKKVESPTSQFYGTVKALLQKTGSRHLSDLGDSVSSASVPLGHE